MPPDLVARIDALEKRAASADVKLDKLADAVNGARVDLGKIEGKLSNLPTTFQLASWFVGVAIGLSALVFAIARVVGR